MLSRVPDVKIAIVFRSAELAEGRWCMGSAKVAKYNVRCWEAVSTHSGMRCFQACLGSTKESNFSGASGTKGQRIPQLGPLSNREKD